MTPKTLFLCLFFFPVILLAQSSKNTGTVVPAELVGLWHAGTFSLTDFWSPAGGQYLGNAGEVSTSYRFAANGTAEEFFIYNATSYNCRTEVLGYRKGTVDINSTTHTLTFLPTSGYYRTANCYKKEWTRKEYGSKDLSPAYTRVYSYHLEGGNLLMKSSSDGQDMAYKKGND